MSYRARKPGKVSQNNDERPFHESRGTHASIV
jgi:hypothetical protein